MRGLLGLRAVGKETDEEIHEEGDDTAKAGGIDVRVVF